MKIKSKKIKIIIISILAVCSIFIIAGLYFYQVAVVPGHKSFINNDTKLVKTDPLYKEKKWYQNAHKQKWVMKSADDNLKLDANYIPVANSKKTVIILHGFMNNKDTMGSYAAMFHKLGYNTLLPDARGHGQSEGNYIGYGWREKVDIKKWAKEVIQKNGSDSKIVIFGVSMGGATTMMASGLAMPKQVKAYIEDCGYTNVKDEVEHEAVDLYHLPAFPRFPLVEVLSGITRLRAGYFLGMVVVSNKLQKIGDQYSLFMEKKIPLFQPKWYIRITKQLKVKKNYGLYQVLNMQNHLQPGLLSIRKKSKIF